MAVWIVEARVPGAGGAWTGIGTIFSGLTFRKEINTLDSSEVDVWNPAAAIENVLVRDNEIRVRTTSPAKEWFRGRIRDATKDPIQSRLHVKALGLAVLLADKTWPGRREFAVIPAGSVVSELASSVRQEPRTNLTVAYDMESLTPDGLMLDLSGNDFHGTLTGTASLGGKYGLARSFNGSSDRIDAGDNGDPGTSDYSLDVWVKPGSPMQAGYIVSKIGAAAGWGLRMTATGNVIAEHSDGTAGVISAQSTPTLIDATSWWHVGLNADRDGTLSVYINGAQSGTTPSIAAQSAAIDNAIPFQVGAANSGNFYKGDIDESHFRTQLLTAADWAARSGRSILAGHEGTIGSFGDIGYRTEDGGRLAAINDASNSVAAEWYVDQNASDQDRLNLVARIGSATPTDTFKFGETVVSADRKIDSESIHNDITVVGYGDGSSRLSSRNFHATTIRSELAVKVTGSTIYLEVDDASSFPSTGIIYVGMERMLYSGVLTGFDPDRVGTTSLTRAYSGDGYASLDAYDHSVDIEVFLHTNTVPAPDLYYTPTNPQTGSSISGNGHRQRTFTRASYNDQDALDLLAHALVTRYKDERESLVIDVREDSIVADIGDDTTVQDAAGAAYKNSPYRIVAMDFTFDERKWILELDNFRDTFDRRMAEIRENSLDTSMQTQETSRRGVSTYSGVDVDLPPTTETALVTVDVRGIKRGQKVRIIGLLNYLTNIAATSMNVRVRRGTGTSGAQVGEPWANYVETDNAWKTIAFAATDTATVDDPKYTMTALQQSGTGNGIAFRYMLTVEPSA